MKRSQGGEVSESGETVTFESMTEADVTELTVGIEPVQDLSNGDPSPTNICPITGHDEVTVTRTGKNLLDPSIGHNWSFYWAFGSSGTGSNVPDGSLTLQRGIYTFSCNQNATTLAVRTSETNEIARVNNASSVTFTLDENHVVKIAVVGLETFADFQLELGSTATSYEPYRSNTYTTSLGQTVYGGTLDMVSGVLTVDKATLTKTLSEATATATIGTTIKRYGFVLHLSSSEAVDVAKRATSISDIAPYDSAFSGEYLHFLINTAGTELYVFVPIGTDTSTTINIVYPLATPLTYQLTAQQIKTLVGTNNVWASSGDIVSITFTYGGLLSELPSEATEIVGKCYCDVEQNGVSSMPFTLNVKKNERAT